MAKKTNIEIGLDEELMQNMFEHNVTIEGLARATGVKVGKLRKAATTPIEGEVYDPNAINYARVAFVLGADVIAGIDWFDIPEAEVRGGGAKDENILRDAGALELNVNYYIRGKATPVQIIMADYETEQFVIKGTSITKDEDGKKVEGPVTLQVVKFSRFLAKAPRTTPRATGPVEIEE